MVITRGENEFFNRHEDIVIDEIVSALDGSDYEVGAMEAAQLTATNNSRALAKLLMILKERNIITKQQIMDMANIYIA